MGDEDAAQLAQPCASAGNTQPHLEASRVNGTKANGARLFRTISRKPVGGDDGAPQYTLKVITDTATEGHSSSQSRSSLSPSLSGQSTASRDSFVPVTQSIPYRQRQLRQVSPTVPQSQYGELSEVTDSGVDLPSAGAHHENVPNARQSQDSYPSSQQNRSFDDSPRKREQYRLPGTASSSTPSSPTKDRIPALAPSPSIPELHVPRTTVSRPVSTITFSSDVIRGRRSSPHLSPSPGGSPSPYGRALSASRRSPESRPLSYVDLLNVPYSQQIAPAPVIGNAQLRSAVGANASLLDTKKTLEMYRANVKKTNDPAIQYEFAIFMVSAAREAPVEGSEVDADTAFKADLLREARLILQKLADRGYPFAQYYLGDGYASGLFNRGKPDWDRAFHLFVAASKHGHAEAGYRAALCYEFGWGCRKDYAKAVQFYRTSASKNHPGAASRLGMACLTGDMGLTNRYREGLKWLKRAAESADFQYNSAPYELGLLHVEGYGDDLFRDEAYAAQLFTKAADLGHPRANLKMGQAYEHGLLGCPRDPALSVHFYTGAAQAGVPEAMMNLCAWYMVGAEPVLEKDENEAYEWAKRAADCGYAKAEYAVGYFTEMGIGCRRDPLEANVWYVRAADQGDERAKQRLAIIRAAASGDPGIPSASEQSKVKKGSGKEDKDCVVM